MGKPHKHAAVIKAWADGAEIQWKTPHDSAWHDSSAPAIPFWYEDWQYRVKPPVLRYKRYLVHFANSDYWRVWTHNERTSGDPITMPGFVKWIDTEWQEYELT
jgi:hypothetical protein